MNYAPRDFSTDPPDAARRKTVLFCRTCGRAANADDWPTRMDDGRVERVDCPDCGTTIWRGLDAVDGDADADAADRVVTPTP